MAFEKIVFAMKTWKDKVSGNTPVTAAELNRIEKGISDCAKQTNALGDSVSPFSANVIEKFITMNSDEVLLQILFRAHNRKEYGFTVRVDGVQLWDNTEKKTVWIINK